MKQVQWDDGRLLVIGGREFSYSGTHFNGDITDVQVHVNLFEKYNIEEWPRKKGKLDQLPHQCLILDQVFSRELQPQDALDFTTCKKVPAPPKSTCSKKIKMNTLFIYLFLKIRNPMFIWSFFRGCKVTLPLGRGWKGGRQWERSNRLSWGEF